MWFDPIAHGDWPLAVAEIGASAWTCPAIADGITAAVGGDEHLALEAVEPYGLPWGALGVLVNAVEGLAPGVEPDSGVRASYRYPPGWGQSLATARFARLLANEDVGGSDAYAVASAIVDDVVVPSAADAAGAVKAAGGAGLAVVDAIPGALPWLSLAMVGIALAFVVFKLKG